jgi:hypothetical protein
MSQRVDTDPSQQVKVTLAGRVIDIATLAAVKDEGIAGIVLQ